MTTNRKKAEDQTSDPRDCVLYRDMRELLARKDIDAVLVATGDRWHTPASLSWILGRKLVFDPAKDEFIGDAEANSLRSRPERDCWA